MCETADLRLVVGLGNPGATYRLHRHNVGFRVIEAFARRRGLAWASAAGPYEAAGTPAGGLVLLKPLTYMNRSGDALRAWSAATRCDLTGRRPAAPTFASAPDAVDPSPGPGPDPAAVRPLIVCDDLVLPLGALRLRARGGGGGQNGLVSILTELRGEDVPRLRLGIGPADRPIAPEDWADYVLSDFAPDEEPRVDEIVGLACDALDCWLETDLATAASRFNRRPPAP